MAERGLTAAFLLSLIVVASADRALLNKPSGGALHGVAFTASYFASGSASASNYFVTNGNGSWTYTPYSTSTNAAYASINSAFQAAGLATGSYGVASTDTAILESAYGNLVLGITDVTFPSKNLGVAVGAAATSASTTPTILITLDGALTWMTVTGVPTTAVVAETVGTAGTAWPTLAAGPPDLTSVFFASKSLGWAAGGLVGNGAANVYGAAVTPLGASGAPATTSAGTILMTTNGGTVWTNVPVNPPIATANVAPQAGALTSIMSDSAGKNVYAVGAPGTVFSVSGTWSLANAAAIQATPLTYGTILYSANSGASWVTQTAPAVATWKYGFMSVYVQKGTTAWAVGGSIADPAGVTVKGNGAIVATFNGGFSWALMSYPGVADGSAPCFTSIAYNGRVAYVGGFISANYYPNKPSGASVTGSNPAALANAGSLYTLLSSTDGKQFNPVPSTSLPAGFVFTSAQTTLPTTNSLNNVFGIVWDNANRGFIYGTGFIMSTQNGGSMWVYETPNFLATAATGQNIVAGLANVPTTY